MTCGADFFIKGGAKKIVWKEDWMRQWVENRRKTPLAFWTCSSSSNSTAAAIRYYTAQVFNENPIVFPRDVESICVSKKKEEEIVVPPMVFLGRTGACMDSHAMNNPSQYTVFEEFSVWWSWCFKARSFLNASDCQTHLYGALLAEIARTLRTHTLFFSMMHHLERFYRRVSSYERKTRHHDPLVCQKRGSGIFSVAIVRKRGCSVQQTARPHAMPSTLISS